MIAMNISQLSRTKISYIAGHITKIELSDRNPIIVESSLGWIAYHANLFGEKETSCYTPKTLNNIQREKVWEFIAEFKQNIRCRKALNSYLPYKYKNHKKYTHTPEKKILKYVRN